MSYTSAVSHIDEIWNLLLPPRFTVNPVWNLAQEPTWMHATYPEQCFTAEEIWNLVQEPIAMHATHPDESYLLMRAALDVGWYIEEPVYLRSRWDDAGAPLYHFILRRGTHEPPKLISAPQAPEVERFVQDHGLCIERND